MPDPPPENDLRVDELRQQLRALGYLDGGVDRFVLGAAREARSPAAIAWLSGLRIGALAAVLIGPAAAIGVAARIPGLITGPRDGFVVAAYLGVVFGAAVCVAAALACLAVSWIARRPAKSGRSRRRPAATGAGIVVAIASLAYLTLWWDVSTFGGLTGTWNVAWTLLGLAFAAGVSLLIGHLVTVASLAVSVAASGAAGERRGVPAASRRVVAVAGALAFGGAVVLFTVTHTFGTDAARPRGLTVVSGGVRLRLVAIDGFDPEIGRRLAEAGRIPFLAGALRLLPPDRQPVTRVGGARASLTIDDTRDPARAWTTIATGQPASVHAVRGLETRRVAGVQGAVAAGEPSAVARALAAATDLVRLTRPAIASGDERRVKTFWEVAADAGLRTAVVNWWATWPARPDTGIVISDRATLRLERGGEQDAEIAPSEMYEVLRQQWSGLRSAAAERATQIGRGGETGDLLRRSAELDAIQLAIAAVVAGSGTDLVCTYLAGLDVVQHALLTTPDGTAPSPSLMEQRLDALEEYYEFVDRLLAETMSAGSDEVAMILTSPGRVQANTSGILTLSGPVANPRASSAVARPVDVAPTVLHALGVPVSRELAGRALIELFSAEFAQRYPVRSVDTYGVPAPKQAPRGGDPLDQEMIDRLRSLGYVR
jgi:hypothetical protein